MITAHQHTVRFVLLLIIALLTTALFAQENQRPKPPEPPGRARTDTAMVARPDTAKGLQPDSAAHILPDSLVHYLLPSLPGSVNRRMDHSDVVDDTAMEWMSARTLNQVLSSRAGILGSEPSGAGQYVPLTVRGSGLRSNAVLVDGRPVADPASGIYNLSLFPMEMADRIEIITGPRSFLYGSGGAGGTVNIVTRLAAHRVPFSKIRYEEAGYEHACSDGSFNQNLTRRTNLSLGYQYLGTGSRYYNSAHEQWNIRGALRYQLLPTLCVILSEHYAQTQTGLNGGINYLRTGFTSSFKSTLATVYSEDAYEKLTRHDLDLRVIGMFLPDSTDLSTLAFYYSHNLREYRDEESDGSAYIHQDQRSSWFGVQAQQSATLGMHHFSAGLALEARKVEASPTLGSLDNPSFSAWVLDDMALTGDITLAAYGRSEVFRGNHITGAGADASVDLGGGFSFRGGTSLAQRAPTYPELFWSDSTLVRDGVITAEKHQLIEAGVHWSSTDFGSVRLMFAHRTITHPILTAPFDGGEPFPGVRLYNGDRILSLTAEITAHLRFFRYVVVEGTGTYLVRQNDAGSALDDCPKFWGEGGIYLAGNFLNENLGLKAGVRGKITTRYSGYVLSPPSLFAAPNTITPLGMGSTLDLVAIAHIGSAYVHIMWENVTDTNYFTSPFTPVMDRTVRFGISWEFLN